MLTIEAIAEAAGAVEVQATYDAERVSPWSVSITTFAHGVPLEPGSMSGTGHGDGQTLAAATAHAVQQYKPNPESEV